MKIYHFQDLEVYKLAFKLQQEIFEISKTFPADEKYSLTDQIRRSSRSVGANIAESWKKRKYVAHFSSKLTDSDSEAGETQHWLKTAHACCYIDQLKFDFFFDEYEHIGKMLGKMINDADHWCL